LIGIIDDIETFQIMSTWINISSRKFGKIICCLILTLGSLCVCFTPSVHAQNYLPDLTEMSLEELMEMSALSSNVLGTHTHLKGEWMVGYHFHYMNMGGNKEGTDDVTETEVLTDGGAVGGSDGGDFTVTPKDMYMQMHMLMLMYGLSDDVTMMLVYNHIFKQMDHIARNGREFTGTSSGPGDTKLEMIYAAFGNIERDEHSIADWKKHRVLLKAGVSLPTGSIDQKDDTPTTDQTTMPFPMQLGSGTWDFLPTVFYLGESESGNWGWTLETGSTLRFGKNSHKYRLGNLYRITASLKRKITNQISISSIIKHHIWGNITGHDKDLIPTAAPTIPTKRPDLRSGERTDLLFGINFYNPGKSGQVNAGNRLSVEFGFPIYENLKGPQLGTDWQMNFGWSWTF